MAPTHATNVEIRVPPSTIPTTRPDPEPEQATFEQLVARLKECTPGELEILEDHTRLKITPTETIEPPTDDSFELVTVTVADCSPPPPEKPNDGNDDNDDRGDEDNPRNRETQPEVVVEEEKAEIKVKVPQFEVVEVPVHTDE